MVTVRSLRTGIKYKETPIGKIPVDWESASVEDVCNILDGKRVPLNKEQRSKIKGNIPYYGANGVVDHINDYIFDDDLILLAEDGGYFDEHKTRPIAYLIHGKSWVNNHAHVLKAKENAITEWLYYSLVNKDITPFIKGGTRTKLNQYDLRKVMISLPPIAEQKKIAEILTTIDNAIEESDKIIEKTKELKKGLMQTLLIRGIGHNKFKKTEIGSIPIEWQVCNIENIASSVKNAIKAGPFGSALKKSIFVDKGYKVYGQEQVIPDDFSVGNYYINEETFNSLKDFAIKPDDVLISLVGTFGKVSVVPKGVERGIINPRLIKITLDFDKVMPSFIKHLMTSELMQNQMSNYTHGLTMGILNTKTIKMLVLPIPSLKEQKEITEILTEIDAEINTEQIHKSNLESLKKSLMQVLLTGKVRVQ